MIASSLCTAPCRSVRSIPAAPLVTAIPAAIAYNKLAGDFSMFSRRMNLGIARFARQLVDLEAAP